MVKKKVTAEHIKDGLRRDACRCPLALMLKECYPNAKINVDVFEDGTVPSVMVDGATLVFTNPEAVAVFITRFDNQRVVKPFFVEWEDV